MFKVIASKQGETVASFQLETEPEIIGFFKLSKKEKSVSFDELEDSFTSLPFESTDVLEFEFIDKCITFLNSRNIFLLFIKID